MTKDLNNLGWIQAIDEALVVSWVGVADAEDSYEVAKEKLAKLINWHIMVATDPSVNGGYALVKKLEETK